MTFVVELSQSASEDLRAIKDARIQGEILRGLMRLETEPAKRGKALSADLKGYYSMRLARQRYRAIYSVAVKEGRVRVVVIGIRKEGSRQDAYAVAQRRLRGEK